MYITIGDPENQIMQEIEEGHTQDSIALTYAFCIRDHRYSVDWKKINRAIINRWSKHAMIHIKQTAWKLVEEQNYDECK